MINLCESAENTQKQQIEFFNYAERLNIVYECASMLHMHLRHDVRRINSLVEHFNGYTIFNEKNKSNAQTGTWNYSDLAAAKRVRNDDGRKWISMDSIFPRMKSRTSNIIRSADPTFWL